jgi:curli biogenesis system outer membrane secretion channel CsgG
MRKAIAAALTLALAASAAPALAQYGMDRGGEKNNTTPDLPHCDRPLGTAAVKEPDRDWWTSLGLSNPEAILKFYALRSGCVRMVDRAGGLAMHNQERGLNESGDLQRGSNVGRGQVLAADYFIIPDIVTQNAHSGGSNFGGMVGGFLPHGFGAVAAGLHTNSSEAHVLITLADARTTEQMYIAEGAAKKTDWSFGGGGGFGSWAGFGGLAGSGYTSTDIGKVIMAAYFNAFTDMIHYMQNQQPGQAAASAPAASQRTTQALQVRAGPSGAAKVVYSLTSGATVYPTGQRNGVWMEVDDENGNRGWVPSTMTTSR